MSCSRSMLLFSWLHNMTSDKGIYLESEAKIIFERELDQQAGLNTAKSQLASFLPSVLHPVLLEIVLNYELIRIILEIKELRKWIMLSFSTSVSSKPNGVFIYLLYPCVSVPSRFYRSLPRTCGLTSASTSTIRYVSVWWFAMNQCYEY